MDVVEDTITRYYSEETPLNILCVDLIGTCIIMIKVQKDNLKLNDPNMIDPVK